MQIFLKQRTISLIHQVLFMDQLLRKISCFILTVIRSVSLNWSLGLHVLFILVRPVHPCASCVNKTTQLFWSTSKVCTASTTIFTKLRYLLLSLNYLVQCLQCWLVLRSNRLQCFAPTHEPQNHQNREGKELRNPLRIPLCCGPPPANLLSAVDTVAVVVGFCIHR